ncbi:hypothetical protein HPB49_016110 [Dermacentor silvarum]|uniref:Uncharacterized protein n=1 Tax=Dermacentor silvarum TaxID=543639 RepID=A0ACB8CY81_DERSI|nr:hypothetical protein HPB49_016110 [Dermacentor silvarum]
MYRPSQTPRLTLSSEQVAQARPVPPRRETGGPSLGARSVDNSMVRFPLHRLSSEESVSSGVSSSPDSLDFRIPFEASTRLGRWESAAIDSALPGLPPGRGEWGSRHVPCEPTGRGGQCLWVGLDNSWPCEASTTPGHFCYPIVDHWPQQLLATDNQTPWASTSPDPWTWPHMISPVLITAVWSQSTDYGLDFPGLCYTMCLPRHGSWLAKPKPSVSRLSAVWGLNLPSPGNTMCLRFQPMTWPTEPSDSWSISCL